MSHATPARGTSTTLRVPRQALFVGRDGAEIEPFVRQLGLEGYFVSRAAQGDEGLEKLRAARFHLVLADVHLPDMTGAQFVAGLRGDPKLKDLPLIVVTTASDDLDAVEQALVRGADDYLPPVFGPAMLRARVSAALNRRGSRDADDLRRDMDVARNIQRDFLPEALPTVRGVALQAVLIPARQVSGDFYDAFPLAPSGNLFLVVGDVCDKGVGAALFMGLFRSLIRASADPVAGGAIQMVGGRTSVVQRSLAAATPGDLLTRVAGFTNNYIARLHGRTNMFATVFMAVLDPASGQLDFVNAGHDPALIIGAGASIRELRPTGPALGMMPDAQFKAGSARLDEGQSLLAFTDGLVEARSAAGETFGGERLRELLRARSTLAAPELVRELVDTMTAFSRQAEPHDDLTMLAATRRPLITAV